MTKTPLSYFVRRRLAAGVAVMAVVSLQAQVIVPPGFQQAPQPRTQAPVPAPAPAAAPAQTPAQPPAANQAPLVAPAAQTTPGAAPVVSTGGLNLQNASLPEVIDALAQQLKLNYILDPRVSRGGVTINTYGETKNIDTRALLDMILRMNGAAIVQHGDIYRVVPLTDIQRMPGFLPEVNGKTAPEDDRPMLNLMFLKYATADEVLNLLKEFLGEHGVMRSYGPANMLMIQDTRRNMKRLLDLIALFDSDSFANERVRLFEVKHGRPSDLVKELEGILKGISLAEKTSPVKLMPVDRINTIIAVAPNPGVFKEVETWLRKLDTEPQVTAGAIDNFVYRVKYGLAPALAMAIMMLYGQPTMGLGMMGGMGMGMGMGGMGMGGMGMGGMGMGGMGMGGMGYGGGMGMGGMGMGGMGYGGMGMGGMGMGGMGMGYGGGMPAAGQAYIPPPGVTPTTTSAGPLAGADATGTYLAGAAGQGQQIRGPRVIPNPFDNTLLIQATRQEYEAVVKLLRELDVPPRQVLIEAKIYEVDLTGALRSGVSAFLRTRGTQGGAPEGASRDVYSQLSDGVLGLSVGALVDRSRELLLFLSAQEKTTRARVISAPSIIATDSITATINVGTEVPTLTAQAVTGAQSQGTSLFANSVANRNSGVTLSVMARVSPSGIVTLQINQEVSAPQPPANDKAIQSPSFSKRSVQTQVTVQDGDTIAIGGIINEDNTSTSSGIPYLHRIPVVGGAFGSRAYDRSRTELVIFMTPRVIYDMNGMVEATDQLRSNLRKLRNIVKD